MAVNVLVTAKAAKDIASIDTYLRRSLLSPAAADAFLDDLEHGVGMVRQFPEMRPLCSDANLASRGYRTFRVGNYIVIYEFSNGAVRLLHVFHQSQNYAPFVIETES